ncbi:MAG: hypothetical protein AMXMBFR53_38830 [Gemmatimonadota bacterium]
MGTVREYDAKLDARNRLTIREARYEHYHVRELSDGTVVLQPRVLVPPDDRAARATPAPLAGPGDEELRGALARWARACPECRMLILFGSHRKGSAHPDSDVDLAGHFDPLPPPRDRLRILGELQDRLGQRRADLVFLTATTDPVLRFEIFRDGERLYESEPGLFVEERVRALMLYEDALPFRRGLLARLGVGSSP